MSSGNVGGGAGGGVDGAGGGPGGAKVCIVCGADCAGKPRVKDPNGRYFCKACYDAKAEAVARRSEQAGRSRAVNDSEADADAGGGLDLASLARAAAAAPALEAAPSLCPGCRRILEPSAVVCVGCGYDTRIGKGRSTRIQKASGPTGPSGAGGATAFVSNPAGWLRWMMSGDRIRWGGVLPTMGIALLWAIAGVPSAVAQAEASRPAQTLGDSAYSAGYHVGAVFGALILGTILYWVIAPLFFRARLAICGGSADSTVARLAYFFSAVPAIVVGCIGAAITVATGGSSISGAVLGTSILMLVLLALGCVQLWHMSWRALGANPIGAAVLMIGLPWAVYGLSAVALFAVALGQNALLPTDDQASAAFGTERSGTTRDTSAYDRAIAASPKTPANEREVVFQPTPRTPVQFTYTADWDVMPPEVDPEMTFDDVVLQAGMIARVSVIVFARDEVLDGPTTTLDAIIEGSKEVLRSEGARLTSRGGFSTFGSANVVGRAFEVAHAGGKSSLEFMVLTDAAQATQGMVVLIVELPSTDTTRQRRTAQRIAESMKFTGR